MPFLALCALAAAPAAAPTNDGSPEVAPVGQAVIFTSDRTGTSQIYAMNPDGSGMRLLTDAPGFGAFDPSWAADGSAFYYGTAERSDVPRRFRTTLVRHAFPGTDSTIVRVGTNEGAPYASVDGRTVYFEARDFPALSVKALTIATGATVVLTAGTERAYNAAPAPDGSRVALVCKGPNDPDNRICTMASDGSALRVLSHTAGTAEHPAWSADSKWIAFQSSIGRGAVADSNIVVMRADGSDEHTITHHTSPQLDETPSWLPGGGSMMIQTMRAPGGFRLAVLSLDGTMVYVSPHA